MQPIDGRFPDGLHTLSIVSLAVAVLCAVAIAVDERRHPQKMGIMNLVWPLSALFGSVFWLFGYYRWGRNSGEDAPTFPVMVAKGSSHCGAGCTLGDLVAEWLAFAVPAVAVWFGWHSLFAEKIFAVWVLDFALAFGFGVLFQYFTIQPMRDLSVRAGLIAAVKADAASITAWQVGMYAMMAAIQFGWFAPVFGGIAPVDSPEFWFAMQIAMLAGFATSYPMNWWLIRIGVKERM